MNGSAWLLNRTNATASVGQQSGGGVAYAKGLQQGLQAGAARFELLIAFLFVALVVEAVASRGKKIYTSRHGEDDVKVRVCRGVQNAAYSAAFLAASAMFVMGVLGIPLVKVVTG